MLWSITEVARLAGTTSRTLRHYDAIGLLAPTEIGENGYRYYDQQALVTLQRILLLRDLGLALPDIAAVITHEADAPRALTAHLDWLRLEQQRLARQIASVTTTLEALTKGTELMAHDMLDGFDHTTYRAEVEERWGADSYTRSNDWWSSMTDAQRTAFQAEHRQIAADYGAAREAGESPSPPAPPLAASGARSLRPAWAQGPLAQRIAERHVRWIARSAEATGMAVTAGYIEGLGDLYVADDRFGQGYDRHGAGTAEFVREALRFYAAQKL